MIDVMHIWANPDNPYPSQINTERPVDIALLLDYPTAFLSQGQLSLPVTTGLVAQEAGRFSMNTRQIRGRDPGCWRMMEYDSMRGPDSGGIRRSEYRLSAELSIHELV